MKFLLLPLAFLLSLSALTGQATFTYSQDFEGIDATSGDALAGDGWQVGANVFNAAGDFIYNYFAFPAPNGGPAFSGVVNTASGTDPAAGPNGGAQYINIYSDYNNGDHINPDRIIEALVFNQKTINSADLGLDYTYTFDFAISGMADGAGNANFSDPNLKEAYAYVTVLDPNNGFATVFTERFDVTGATTTWLEDSTLSGVIDNAWDGHIIQWGFGSNATGFVGTGVLYDNLSFVIEPTPEPAIPTMGQWALLILGLMMTSLGLVYIKRRSIA